MSDIVYNLKDTLTHTVKYGLTASNLRSELFRIGLTTDQKISDDLSIDDLISYTISRYSNEYDTVVITCGPGPELVFPLLDESTSEAMGNQVDYIQYYGL